MLGSPESATLAVTIIPVSPEGGVAVPGPRAPPLLLGLLALGEQIAATVPSALRDARW